MWPRDDKEIDPGKTGNFIIELRALIEDRCFARAASVWPAARLPRRRLPLRMRPACPAVWSVRSPDIVSRAAEGRTRKPTLGRDLPRCVNTGPAEICFHERFRATDHRRRPCSTQPAIHITASRAVRGTGRPSGRWRASVAACLGPPERTRGERRELGGRADPPHVVVCHNHHGGSRARDESHTYVHGAAPIFGMERASGHRGGEETLACHRGRGRRSRMFIACARAPHGHDALAGRPSGTIDHSAG